jgi:hypothetical protein
MTDPKSPPKPDPQPAPPSDRSPPEEGGMIDEGGVYRGNVEGVESETETRRDGGMIGEG